MTRDELRRLLADAPLVASVQASDGSPLDDPATIVRLARASVGEGVRLLRLEGIENIRAVRAEIPVVPVIGLIKRRCDESDVYITPALAEVGELLSLGCEIVAFDATARPRPGGVQRRELITAIRGGGALAMADVASISDGIEASSEGAEIVSTTLSGYVSTFAAPESGPDLALVAELAQTVGESAVIFAEGRYARRDHVIGALVNGAHGVVVGGALNDPVKMTRALMPPLARGRIVAFDLGGTWLRCGTEAGEIARVRTPATRRERLDWMRERIAEARAERAAVSSGGTLDPTTGEVWEAKPMIPEHLGTLFDEASLGVPTIALNDGHCAALAHARLPGNAGRRIATLALGTGVGAGFVADGKLWRGAKGEYLRLNDLPLVNGGRVESALGGLALRENEDREEAKKAFRYVLDVFRRLFMPEIMYLCGSVGLSDWLRSEFEEGCVPSPFGADAALNGALSLARWGE